MTTADWIWDGVLGLIVLTAAYCLGAMLGFRAGQRQCERGHDGIRAAAFHAGRSGPWPIAAQKSADYLAGYVEGRASVRATHYRMGRAFVPEDRG